MIHAVEGKTVLVAGLGKSGLAAARLLLEQGAKVVASDERPNASAGELGFRVLPQTEETFSSVDVVVLSPGIPVDLPAVTAARAKGIPVIGEVELASYYLRGPVIGITGSNGKTTTTALIGHLLQTAGIECQVGGNIGTPPTAMVATSSEQQWNVLELSSFQLETIDHFRAAIGVCTNVTPDHLDRHHTFERYASAKARLFETQDDDCHAVLNSDDATCVGFGTRTKGRPHWFSRRQSTDVYFLDGIIRVAGEALIRSDELPIRGVHNVENAMAAATAAHLAGAPLDRIASGLRTFPGVEHRLEFVREYNGVSYFNDSKATNVDATEKAIDAFPGRLWIILGGKDKNSDYSVLRDKLLNKSKGILLIGAAAPKIASQLSGLPLIPAETVEAAVREAASQAIAGDVVLLAPACASFDQFESFEHRGRVFKDLVRSL